ncbi:MAG: hypothetical protein Q4A42_01170 [Tissierellia bacterium]|nr:hypothetical protein [Tissierellia bacterium]
MEKGKFTIEIERDLMYEFTDTLKELGISVDTAISSLAKYVIENMSLPQELEQLIYENDSSAIEEYKRQLSFGGISGFDLDQLAYQFEKGIEESKKEK